MQSKRIQFSIQHLLVSISIAAITLLWVFNVWYPTPLAKATDVTHIFLILLVVDVILGPLLGFIIYKEGKKTLKFDLAVIFILQIAAFGYGVHSIAQARPLWLAYNVDRFELIRANELMEQNTRQALSKYQQPSWLKPQWVGVSMSDSLEEKNQNLFEEVLAGISLAQRPERYVDLEKVKNQIRARARNMNELKEYNEPEHVDALLNDHPTANAWLPLKANAVDMTVLINKETGEVLKIVDLRPWN